MANRLITRDEVVSRADDLPSFPRIIIEILATLDDPEANLNVLSSFIERDPAITARVLSLANMAATRTRRLSAVHSIFTATSLIGMGRVRQMTVISTLADFISKVGTAAMPATFWQHSVAVGVCCEELALHTATPASVEVSLIAGLLHDVGQLWLYGFEGEAFRAAWGNAFAHATGIEQAERDSFGVSHSTIGAWLAEHWQLPANIASAIRHHHAPDEALEDSLVSLVHVAEVLSNALDLTGREENQVASISGAACKRLGLVWNDGVRALFGRMEARSRHANAMFE